MDVLVKSESDIEITGFIASFSYLSVPVISKLPDDLVAKQWKDSYKIGAGTAPFVAIGSSICFGFLALQCMRTTELVWPFASY